MEKINDCLEFTTGRSVRLTAGYQCFFMNQIKIFLEIPNTEAIEMLA